MPGLSSMCIGPLHSWMMLMRSRFVYQVVVPKALAPKDLVEVYESGEFIVLPPWDPMVSNTLHSRCPRSSTTISGCLGLNAYVSHKPSCQPVTLSEVVITTFLGFFLCHYFCTTNVSILTHVGMHHISSCNADTLTSTMRKLLPTGLG